MTHIETESQTPKTKTHGLSIASMVLGILSFVVAGVFSSLPGLILGIISLRKIKKSAGLLVGRGFAITGIVTSSLNLLLYILLIGALLSTFFTSGLHEANPKTILENGRLANLPVSATNVEANEWSALFTGMEYLMFKATPEDIEKFIAGSESIKDIEPEFFTAEHQNLPHQDLLNVDPNLITDEEAAECLKHKYFIPHGGKPEWYNPTIKKNGRIYKIPGDPEMKGHNWGEVIINDETNTVYIWVCWS